MVFVGVDVSKDYPDCAIVADDTAKLLGERYFPNISEGTGRLVTWMRRLRAQVRASIRVVEAGYYEQATQGVVAAGMAVLMASPARMRSFARHLE